MSDDLFDDLIDANRSYQAKFALSGVPGRAAKRLGLVTCMDSRIDPLAILGLAVGDAKVIRNAGGRVTPDVLRSLALATTMLDVDRIAIMQHTRCALAGRTDSELATAFPADVAEEAGRWPFLAMPDPDASLREDVDAVRNCRLISGGVAVEGWRYDVEAGAVARVVTT